MSNFNFNISLSVLNHLGRNLYRNFITVLGEAISNAWDADAKNVWITIDKDANSMIVKDDGIGMTDDDFQNKFLKIGYSKRKNNSFNSPLGRPFIGRKGIGKLALLSCAQQIQIVTKCKNTKITGGLIDNGELDEAIKDDINANEYILKHLSQDAITAFGNQQNGTLIYFNNITEEIHNTIDYIRKAIALYFRFSIIDKDFKIYVNNDLINEKELEELAQSTQFVWILNGYSDNYLNAQNSIKNIKATISKKTNLRVSGFIATTEKPRDIKIRGTNEKVTLDLFVNGRLREKDILKHIPTARIVESYTYGQIFFDELDTGDCPDIFTSSRESVVANDTKFNDLLTELKKIYANIIEEWDTLRRKFGFDGDVDNTTISKKARKAEELYRTTMKDMNLGVNIAKQDTVVEKWANELAEESQFNIPSYTECFISENLLRKYIEFKKLPLSKEAIEEAAKWKERHKEDKNKANISYTIRQNENDIYYLDMDHLANFVDKATDKLKTPGISRSAVVYKPLRDAVGHTSIISNLAKTNLSVEFENIKARLGEILKATQEEQKKSKKED